MDVDEALVGSLSSYSDARTGINERFLKPIVGGKRTVGVLSEPTGPRRDMGWVICHSFAMEQVWLQPLEVAAARLLAHSGFAVLRFHSQGYGDSEGSTTEIGLETQIRDAVDAVAVLLKEAGLSRAGLVGGRVGGTVAALAAERSDVPAVVLWEPVVDGRRYVEALTRAAMVTELSSSSQVKAPAGDVERRFAEAGIIDVQGFPLTRAVFQEFSALDLLSSVTRFRGDSLVVQISRSGRPRSELERLSRRFNETGGRSALEVIVDPNAWRFGLQRYYSTSDGRRKEDKQAILSDQLVRQTVSWCLGFNDSNVASNGEHDR